MDARREQQERDNRERQAQRDRERQAREEAGDTMVATDDAFGASDDFASGDQPIVDAMPIMDDKMPVAAEAAPADGNAEKPKKPRKPRAPRPKKTDAVGEGGDQPSPLAKLQNKNGPHDAALFFGNSRANAQNPSSGICSARSVGLIPQRSVDLQYRCDAF